MSHKFLKPSRHDVYPFISPKDALAGAASDRNVLISGAGTGIGRAVAQAFAQAGASSLTLAGRRQAPLEETAALITAEAPGCSVHIRPNTDVSSQTSVDALFSSLPVTPDVVVANAGKDAALKHIGDSDPDEWWSVQQTNVYGSYLLTRAFLRSLSLSSPASSERRPVVVIMSSIASTLTLPGNSAYAGSKVMVNHFTEYVDRENDSVTCIALHPGGIADTEMASRVKSELIRSTLIDTASLAGGTTVYLTTERAAFLSGRYVDGTWDMEELEKLKPRIVDEDLLKMKVAGF